jgi:hypothetical protein
MFIPIFVSERSERSGRHHQPYRRLFLREECHLPIDGQLIEKDALDQASASDPTE